MSDTTASRRQMRVIICLLGLISLSIMACASEVRPVPEPQVQAMVDLGTVYQGQDAAGIILVNNPTNEPLSIDEVVGDCSCLVQNVPKQPIAPNAQGTIKIHMRTADKVGEARGKYLIRMSAGKATYDRHVAVVAHVSIEGKVVARPGAIYLGTVRGDSELRAEVRLEQLQSGSDSLALEVSKSPDWVRAETSINNGIGQLVIEARAPRALGRIMESIVLTTGNDRFPTVEIPLIGTVVGDVVVDPGHVLVTVGAPQDGEINSSVAIVTGKDKIIAMNDAAVQGIPGGAAELRVVRRDDRSFEVRVDVHADRLTARVMSGTITGRVLGETREEAFVVPLVIVSAGGS